MLTLAMQLHDQYVDKGKAKAKEITDESQRRYDELIGNANDTPTALAPKPTTTPKAPVPKPISIRLTLVPRLMAT